MLPAKGGIPEPGIVLYGAVETVGGSLVHSGELTWRFTPESGGEPAVFRTQLKLIPGPGGPYSYALRVPAESVAAGFPASADALVFGQPGTEYALEVRYGDSKGVIKGASTVSASPDKRGAVMRADIAGVALDGMHAPELPYGPQPGNRWSDIPADTDLTWNASEYADYYEVYLWPLGENPAGAVSARVETTSFTPPQLLAEASIYQWQVVAYNGSVATPGPIWMFATVGADLSRIATDLNGDERVNALDIQLIINAALGIEGVKVPLADTNGDGVVNAVDIQNVINGALGIIYKNPSEYATLQDEQDEEDDSWQQFPEPGPNVPAAGGAGLALAVGVLAVLGVRRLGRRG